MAAATLLASLVAALFLQSCCGALTSNSVGDSCTTPDNKPGVCRLIKQCPALIALLEGRPTQENIIFLNRARCGFSGDEPIVCCAGAPSTSRPGPATPTATPTPTPTPRPRPPISNPGTGPRDVRNHPNLRLLPLATCAVGLFDRVVGGKEADIHAYPFIARLGYWTRRSSAGGQLSYRCGGTLINNKYVLTAAHCVTNLPGSLRLGGVRFGEHNVDTDVDCSKQAPQDCLPPVRDYEVEETVVHPDYSPREMTNDIALVRLRGRVNFEEHVQPVCLPVGLETQSMRLDNTNLVVTGWGTTESGQGSPVLLDVALPGVPLSKCKDAYSTLGTQVRLSERQMCAGGEKGRDSCTGDSGGPLLFQADVDGEEKGVQFGIVSFGPRNCGTGGVPGIYTRVGYYMDWILSSMRP